jgi:type I restriction enzyme S subunit
MVMGLAISAPDQTGGQQETGRFRESEAGLIPADWEAVYIEDIATITTGSRNTQDRVKGGVYPFFVRSQNVERINSYSFEKEAVLTAGDGVGTGKIFHYIDGKFDVHQRVYVMSDFVDRISGYFFYLVFSSRFYDRIMQMTAKSSVDSVRREMIARMAIPLPPRREQDAIVEALQEADGLIVALEQLIEKKRLIKQGAMQELLSGRRRLPGFSGEVSKRKFGEIAVPRKRRINPATAGWQPFCVELEHISKGTGRLEGWSEARENASLKAVFEKGDVLFGKLRAYLRKYWRADRSGVCSTEFWVLAPAEDMTTSSYLYQVVQTDHFIEVASQGYGTHMPRSDWSSVSEIELPVPALDEQEEIGRVPGEMDAEIEALHTRLDKARQIKQGMMQELLTGRVRLV